MCSRLLSRSRSHAVYSSPLSLELGHGYAVGSARLLFPSKMIQCSSPRLQRGVVQDCAVGCCLARAPMLCTALLCHLNFVYLFAVANAADMVIQSARLWFPSKMIPCSSPLLQRRLVHDFAVGCCLARALMLCGAPLIFREIEVL